MSDKSFDWTQTQKRTAYAGLDLSKSGDMTALVVIIPLDDGRVAVKGRYWFPKEGLAQRELDYRMPVRTWHKEGKLELSAGREIDYEQIRIAIREAKEEFDLKVVAYDAWGSKYLAETLVNDGVPLQTYRMAISTFGPGCALFNNMWLGKKLVFPDDPIMRRACAEAVAKTDINGNVRPAKSREHSIIDPLVAAIMALHCWGGKSASIYEIEADMINGVN
jgi:phage terminase large subunit-like protein